MVNNKSDPLSRHDVATMLGLHVDSVSRAVATGGLAAAVSSWGGHGKPMRFHPGQVARWAGVQRCRERRPGGHLCTLCHRVADDLEAISEHLLEVRHGYGSCVNCRATWTLCQPCQ